jgi:hypothetical protein
MNESDNTSTPKKASTDSTIPSSPSALRAASRSKTHFTNNNPVFTPEKMKPYDNNDNCSDGERDGIHVDNVTTKPYDQRITDFTLIPSSPKVMNSTIMKPMISKDMNVTIESKSSTDLNSVDYRL